MDVEALLSTVKQAQEASTMEAIKIFYDGLVKYERNKLPENIFKQTILPLITDELDEDIKPKAIEFWLGVAGSYLADISIIDTSGKELFILPSILDGNVISRMKNGDSLHGIVSKGQLLSNNLPILQEKFLINTLSQKDFSNDYQSVVRHKLFAAIINHYKKPSEGKVTVSKKVDDISDDLVYD